METKILGTECDNMKRNIKEANEKRQLCTWRKRVFVRGK
jgi:hypothetical protein